MYYWIWQQCTSISTIEKQMRWGMLNSGHTIQLFFCIMWKCESVGISWFSNRWNFSQPRHWQTCRRTKMLEEATKRQQQQKRADRRSHKGPWDRQGLITSHSCFYIWCKIKFWAQSGTFQVDNVSFSSQHGLQRTLKTFVYQDNILNKKNHRA